MSSDETGFDSMGLTRIRQDCGYTVLPDDFGIIGAGAWRESVRAFGGIRFHVPPDMPDFAAKTEGSTAAKSGGGLSHFFVSTQEES